MLRTPKTWLALAATGTALALATGPALADSITVSDADDDAVEIYDGEATPGDHDIDLRSVVIDHGSSDLRITSAFSVTEETSWTEIFVDVDTNLDGQADYFGFWSKSAGSGVVRIATEEITCAEIGRGEQLGTNGTVTLTIPRSCLGTPASVAVRVDAVWDGEEAETGKPLVFLDSAPDVVNGVPVFSRAVAASAPPVTVPSPNPPAPHVNPPSHTGPSAACVKAKVALKKAKKSKNVAKIKKARKKVKRAC